MFIIIAVHKSNTEQWPCFVQYPWLSGQLNL